MGGDEVERHGRRAAAWQLAGLLWQPLELQAGVAVPLHHRALKLNDNLGGKGPAGGWGMGK